MESPLKRKRLSLSPAEEDEPSDVDLHEARARNDMRLKSIFEGIFEKYGRDFTDVGDEIDLQTGDIMVNNGHIHTLDGEDNAGAIGDWLSDPDSQAPMNEPLDGAEEEGARARLNTHEGEGSGPERDADHSGRRVVSILSHMRPDPGRSREVIDGDGGRNGDGTPSEAEDDRSSVDSLLDTALSVQGPHIREVGNGGTVKEKANLQPEESDQSQVSRTERLDETVDPIWRVPEINVKLTTPMLLSRSKPKSLDNNTVRSQSPPGAGSIWALPWTSRRNTGGVKSRKQKDSPKKQKKHHSSPIVCDWSFADAPDGSESDDPLQEDYEPSPTPKGSVYIREKRKGPFSAASRRENTCSYCKKSFSEDDYISHLRAVLSDPADNQHDMLELKHQLGVVTNDSTTGSASNATTLTEPIVRPIGTPTSGLEPKGQDASNESTPTGKRARTTLGPDEAKSIIRMRQVHGMKWKEILNHFPQKKLTNIQAWHHIHWNQRRANPPRLSGPWSKAELEKLERLRDQPDLTWPGIRAEMPGRLLAEVEFKLLQLWTGGNISQDDAQPRGEER
ncbi:Myb-like DNA-binding domain protein [Aspergillus puulaauensis]|uniref:Centromere protein Scm3-domain-containing protein n=1 Tax=Aspergillus puulaauensis TaxID=1220207 RepID=A0A7R8AL37_9EURO|nr:uncharacterized protein APUU_21697A [Aspergillus puulaauensis]BCS21265.1 hypothetical protein APUU_21697A [Aspergillus puulaauensis]